MPSISLHDDTVIEITPADVQTDQRDVVLLLQAFVEMTDAGKLTNTQPAAYDQLARLLMPYVSGATVEQLSAGFKADPFDFQRVLRRVLLNFIEPLK